MTPQAFFFFWTKYTQLAFNPKYVVVSKIADFTVAAKAFFTVTTPTLNWITSDMQATRNFAPALAAKIDGEVGTFDFGPRLPSNVIIVSVTSITATVHSPPNADPNPQLIVKGSPNIITSPTSNLPSQAVDNQFLGGLGGVVYAVVCLVMCSDGVPRSTEAHIPFYTPS